MERLAHRFPGSLESRKNPSASVNGAPSVIGDDLICRAQWNERVSTDKRSGIVNDPNREDDPESIVRLIGQVVTVSLETVRLVRELSALQLLPKENRTPSPPVAWVAREDGTTDSSDPVLRAFFFIEARARGTL